MHQPNVSDLVKFYSRQQRGGGLNDDLLYYKSSYRNQRGNGLGSIFGAIAKRLIPFAKQVLWPAAKKYVLPHAKTAALGLTEDLLEGKNLRSSLKERGSEAIKGATQQLRDQSGSGFPTKQKRKIGRPRKTPYKKSVTLDLSKWQGKRK